MGDVRVIHFYYEVIMKNYIIPIFIPHYGCQNQCVFCNQHKITGMQTNVNAEVINKTITQHLSLINKERHIEVAFYGGSFTALNIKKQIELLTPAYHFLKDDRIDAIRVSTRPDCINKEVVDNLLNYGVSTIELGVQSLDDQVLAVSQRGHDRESVFAAIRCIRQTKLKLGIQLMPGLPKDSLLRIMQTVSQTIKIKPDFVRIYPTLVLVNTSLATLFYEKKYTPLSLDTAVKYCASMKLLFERNHIPVIRVGLQATEALDSNEVVIAGPYHPSFGEIVDSYLFHIIVSQLFEKLDIKDKQVIIHHHVKDTSKIRGMKNANTTSWYHTFQPQNIVFKQDSTKIGQIEIEFNGQQYSLNLNIISNI